MVESICTTESFAIEEIKPFYSKCMFCCKKTKKITTYVGIYCSNCKSTLSGEEWSGDIARRRRELLGLTKKQLGEKIGKSKHTIHGYEWRRCSEIYLQELEKLLIGKKGEL